MRREHVLLVTLIAACTPEPAVDAASVRVQVPGLQCSLEVPADTSVVGDSEGATLVMRPGTRSPRSLVLSARATDVTGEPQVLAPGVSIVHTVRTTDGGSGGEQSVLDGVLQMGGRSLAVTCNDQREWPGTPDARWCLPWLATIRVEPAR